MKKESRFEIRWTSEQKEIYERASKLAGFNSLSGFVTSTVQEKADAIILEHEKILASERDKKIFFDAIVKGNVPNDSLRKAARKFKKRNLAEEA